MMDNKVKALQRRIYVGNIPYNAKESEVIKLLSIAGPVLSFRLNNNKKLKSI